MPTSKARYCKPMTWENNFRVENGRAYGEPIPDADGWECCMCRKPNLNRPNCGGCGHGRCTENTGRTRFERSDVV